MNKPIRQDGDEAELIERAKAGDTKAFGILVERDPRRVVGVKSVNTLPFGLIQMDNGEIAILCSREIEPPKGRVTIEPIIAFSKDGGANWTDFQDHRE